MVWEQHAAMRLLKSLALLSARLKWIPLSRSVFWRVATVQSEIFEENWLAVDLGVGHGGASSGCGWRRRCRSAAGGLELSLQVRELDDCRVFWRKSSKRRVLFWLVEEVYLARWRSRQMNCSFGGLGEMIRAGW